MFRQSILITAVVMMLTVMPAGAQAQSIDLKTAMERMTAIIAEMEKLRTEFSKLVASTGQTPTPTVLGAQTNNAPVFTLSLEPGVTNGDIARIQKLLATDPEIYPYGVSSGFFGPKTEEAINNLQVRNGWNPVGVIGPATRALLEAYFRAYPDEKFPADVLKSKPPAPKVLGASVSSPTTPTTGQPVVSGSNLAKKIAVTLDDGEALIEINYTNGNRKGLIANTDDKDKVVAFIASRTVLTEAMIREVIVYSGRSSSGSSSSKADKSKAEQALDDAEEALDDAAEAIEEADDDGEDVDWAEDTLDEADELFADAEDAFDDKDYVKAIALAQKAIKKAKQAEDRIGEKKKSSSKGDADDIDTIEVQISKGKSKVTVIFENDDESSFTVKVDKEADIIKAIAKELDIDEDDVEDLVEFDYGKVVNITVKIDKGKGTALARVFYKSGIERRVRLNTTNENKIIEGVADEIGEDEDDVEDWIEFD